MNRLPHQKLAPASPTRRAARHSFGALLLAASFALGLGAQSTIPVATEFDKLHFRSIGPATMSGRIADVAVYEADPAVFFVATAHGGVWKTTSNGATWEPLLQDQGLLSFGDVTLSQTNPNLVWAGGGESNNRQSTSWGDGVYKSTDGGKTWTHMGLRESRHIHRIVIDPANNDVVLVAATGPLWGSGGERGVYKTTDGGRSWRKVLGGDEDTGANDIVMSASDPKVIFASMYQRRRSACCMNGGGPGSALHKSVDGGETWTKVGGGYPTGELGRIAVDVSRSNPNIVYSLVEAQVAAPTPGQGGQAAQQTLAGNNGLWRSDDAGATWRKVNNANPRPMYFSKVLVDPTNPETVYFGGVGLHMSLDGGKTVETDAAMVTHDDIHALWVNPRNPNHIVIGNDGGVAKSYDQAKSWIYIPNLPVGLFYHVSYDMETPFNICGGMQDNYNWCGPSRSRFGAGIQNHDWFQILGGDGFHAIPDLQDSRIVYTESQNGNMIRRNVVTGESKSIRPSALNSTPAPAAGENYRFHWDAPMMLSPNDPGVMLVAANKVFRSTDRGDSWAVISPDLTTNMDRDTTLTMGVKGADIKIARHDGITSYPAIVSLAESPRQAGVIWTGTDDGVVHVTRDGGKSWTNVTSRLAGFPAGAFVSEVVPSRFDAGTAYVAVDNHRQNDYAAYVWMTTDFGATFRRVDGGLRGEVVHTLTEDTKNANVLYVGAESGMFLSLDRGATWRRLKANLPNVRIDEITIHPRDNAMLVGTHGRSIFVLDNLEPIQEYAAAASASRSVSLFSVPTALQWKYKDDRNDEFWGHQTFSGENPPIDAVINFHVKTAPKEMMVRISSGNRVVRELSVPAAKLAAGIQTVCWDMRVAPVPAIPGQGGGGGGGGGGQFGGGNQARPIPGVRAPRPDAGYLPTNICAAGGPGAGGGGGGFGGFGGGANNGPYVAPGTYSVALVADGQVVDTKPMRVVMDPEVKLAERERVAYDRVGNELHEAQRVGTAVATRLAALGTQIGAVGARIDTAPGVSAEAKTRFNTLKADFETVRVKFGVAAPRAPGATGPAAGGPGGGGGGGFGAAPTNNALGRVGQAKANVIGVWEVPSAATLRQGVAARAALDEAMREANALLARANALGAELRSAGLTLGAP